MLGGGFLGQAHETSKQNREMLKSIRRKPDGVRYVEKGASDDVKFVPLPESTPEEKAYWSARLAEERQAERRKAVTMFVIAVVIVAALAVLLWFSFSPGFFRLWSD